MGQTPGDDKNEPSLELPSLSLPGFGRRKKPRRQRAQERRAELPAEPEPTQTYDEPTQQLPVGPQPEPQPEPRPEPQPIALNGHAPTETLEPEPEPVPVPVPSEPSRRRARRERSTPSLPGPVSAVLTGVIVGAVGAAATYGAMTGCEAVRGVSTCGGAPGFFILVAIFVLMVLLGSAVLKAFRVSDSNSTSFLAVGVVTVIVMLTLLDVIFSVWMFAVIPVLSALAFLLANWVTTRFDEAPTDVRR